MLEQGAENMQKAIENYAKNLAEEYYQEYVNEQAAKCVKIMLDDSIPLETALRFANIDLQTYERYSKNIQ